MTALSLQHKEDDSARHMHQYPSYSSSLAHSLSSLRCDEILGQISIAVTACCTTAVL